MIGSKWSEVKNEEEEEEEERKVLMGKAAEQGKKQTLLSSVDKARLRKGGGSEAKPQEIELFLNACKKNMVY